MKKLLSFSLALLMLLGTLTVFAGAVEPTKKRETGDLIAENFSDFNTTGVNYYNAGVIDASTASGAEVVNGYLKLTGDADGSYLTIRPTVEQLAYYMPSTSNSYSNPLFAIEFKVKTGTGSSIITDAPITDATSDAPQASGDEGKTDMFSLASSWKKDATTYDADRQLFTIRPQGRIASGGNNNSDTNGGKRWSLNSVFAADSDWKTVKIVLRSRQGKTIGYYDVTIDGDTSYLGDYKNNGGYSNMTQYIENSSDYGSCFKLGFINGNSDGKTVYLDDIKIYNVYDTETSAAVSDKPFYATPEAIGYQLTTPSAVDKTHDIRFVASVGGYVTNYDAVGFELTASYVGNDSLTATKTWDLSGNKVSRHLDATTPDGKTAEAVSAESYNRSALFALTITDVPADRDVTWTVTPYLKKGTEMVYGETVTETVAAVYSSALEDLSGYASGMIVDPKNKLTLEEVKAFVGYVEEKTAPGANNIGNAMLYGDTGSILEGLNLVYKQTGYTRMLPVMCEYADAILVSRNDQAKGEGVTFPMGGIQPAWINTEGGTFAEVEIGDICGHILFVAENILKTPSMWDVTVPDGDPYGYGATYKARALTYVELCDQTLRDYLMTYFINTPLNTRAGNPLDYRAYEDETRTGITTAMSNCSNAYHPWNRQFMMVGGFIHGAACHKLLGDDAALADEYDKVVQALVDFFLEEEQLQPITTPAGNPGYLWYYWPIVSGASVKGNQTGGKIEDANDAHMAYDVYGMYMCQLYGYQNVTDEVMARFSHTFNDIIYDPENTDGVFHGSVNGNTGKADKNFVWEQLYLLGIADERSYDILLTPPSVMGNNLNKNVRYTSRILYLKSILYGKADDLK